MACVAAGFFVVLKVGFLLHNDPMPDVVKSEGLTALAVIVLACGLIALARAIWKSVRRAARQKQGRKEASRSVAAFEAARKRRVEELSADPDLVFYAKLVEKGEWWTDEQIAYHRDRSATVTCAHLQPLERLLRSNGIDARLFRDQGVSARCRIDERELERQYPLESPVRYSEFYQGDRYEYEHPTALFICDEHKAVIHTLHPESPGITYEPVFPDSSVTVPPEAPPPGPVEPTNLAQGPPPVIAPSTPDVG
jgi:hypothetical protein